MKSGIETKISFVSQLFSCIIALEVTVLFCIKCTTDYVSFDDFIGDAFDEGVRHRRPGFHKVPPIKRKVEKVFILLISVNSLKESCPHSAKMSSKATFHCSFVCRALRNRRHPASSQPLPMVSQRENKSLQNPHIRSVLILR